jgi:PAS domain S-box-containing protein
MSARLVKLGDEDVVLSITRDITDRINMEKDLQRSEERYKAIVKAQPDIFFRLNKDLIFTDYYTNDPASLLIPTDKIIGSKAIDSLPYYLFSLTKEKMSDTFKTLKVQTYEYMLEIKGEERWFDARMVPSSEEEVFVIVRDMTENKKAEKAIAESELKYRKLISNISDVIVVIDKNGKINYKSSNIENYFGWKPEDLIGNDAMYTVHPEDKIFVSQELDKLLQIDNYKTTFEFDYLCKDGNYKPVELTALSLLNDSTINGIIANYKDISERKKAEQIVIQTQRLGAIGEMSSAIAHDFNNSLQSIYGNLELALLKIEDNHISRKFLETIKTAASDASARVKLLQRFAGKAKGKEAYKKVNIKNIIEDVILQSRPIWKDNPEKDGYEITISKNIDVDINIKGDEAELRSVLYNIIKNSVEAMPKGGEINISAVKENNNAVLTCKDSGIGMNEETRSRIFQPFFTTKGFESGRGLGMSGVYSIIKEHGGTIYVKESNIGIGTTIKIKLPISIDNLEQIEIKSSENKNMKDLNILWVDDDSLIRDIAEEMLEVLEHKGKIVQNGEKALELLKNESFDLVVTDIGMPGMNGWDLADKIREEFNDKIKIIALTGWGDQISDEKRKQHGVSELLSKPFKIEQLKGIINKVMQ